ncbi:MAG: 4Fe-4S dicluster domain-containing protein [Candidatus Korarchaeota archaeon]|nr:4Fe-4S dicluster domain-containing protein [Candidatus Korarchaeota archaeon]
MTRYGMIIDLRSCIGCGACIAACDMENETPWEEGKRRTHVPRFTFGSYPNVTVVYMPRLCMHCENPPCVSVCPTGASHVTADGVVLVEHDLCIGCKYCVVACPYDARYVDERIRSVDKCTFCYTNRVLKGEVPACDATCPGRVRIFGDLDDPNSEAGRLAASGLAKPLRPDLGTNPKVLYVPKVKSM